MNCKFKKEGDEFFIDSICDNGRTITIYPQNQPAPSNCIRLRCSSLYSRLLLLLKQLEENLYHQNFYNNFHASLNLAKGAMIYP